MKRIYILVAVVTLAVSLVWLRVRDSRPNATTSISSTPTMNANNSSSPAKPKTELNKSKYSISSPTSPWIVVNKKRPLKPLTYAPVGLVAVGNSQFLKAQAAQSLAQMFAGANRQGLKLVPLSGYRSYQTQVSVYANEVNLYGQAVADTESARPGYSEHQTGWAIDIGGGGCGIDSCFGNTKESKWVADNAYKYGFIVRYIAGKQAITGYKAEPWHIRYIGTELSLQMHKTGITTLEEFFGL